MDLNFSELYPEFVIGSTAATSMSGQSGATNTVPEIIVNSYKDFNNMKIIHFEKYITIEVTPEARRLCNFNNGAWRDYEWVIKTNGDWQVVKSESLKRELEKTLWMNKNYDIDSIIGENNKNPQLDRKIDLSKNPFETEEVSRVNKNLNLELDVANKKIKELENLLNKSYQDLNLTNGAVRNLTQQNNKLVADLEDAKKVNSKKSFLSKIFKL